MQVTQQKSYHRTRKGMTEGGMILLEGTCHTSEQSETEELMTCRKMKVAGHREEMWIWKQERRVELDSRQINR